MLLVASDPRPTLSSGDSLKSVKCCKLLMRQGMLPNICKFISIWQQLARTWRKNTLVIRVTFLHVVVNAKNSKYYKCKLIAAWMH